MQIGIQAVTTQGTVYTLTLCRNWQAAPGGSVAGCQCKTAAEMTRYHLDYRRDAGAVPAAARLQIEQQLADGALSEMADAMAARLTPAQRLVGRSITIPGVLP